MIFIYPYILDSDDRGSESASSEESMTGGDRKRRRVGEFVHECIIIVYT